MSRHRNVRNMDPDEYEDYDDYDDYSEEEEEEPDVDLLPQCITLLIRRLQPQNSQTSANGH